MRAVKYGTGAHATGSPEDLRKKVDLLKAQASKVSRDLANFTIVTEPWISLTPNSNEAAKKALATPIIKQRYKTEEQFISENLAGNEHDITEKIQEFIDAGATYTQLRFVTERTDLNETIAMMKQFSQLMPSF